MPVDLLFTNASVYNVFLKEWFVEDVAVHHGKIFYTGDASSASIQGNTAIDCGRKPLIPGLIDIHLHIESSLCTPIEFAHAVLAHGVTTVVAEPHEIANVSGLAGIEEFIRLSRDAAIDIFYGIPSSVPSTRPELESTGGMITQKDITLLLERYPEVVCLGEVMDFHGLINGTAERIRHNIEYIQRNHPLTAIEGHCPNIVGRDLSTVLYHGVDSDHCLQLVESMKDRFKQGMFVEIQEKSVQPDIIAYLSEYDRDGLYCFVTDDVPPDILCDKGHLDHVVRSAMGLGLPLERAIIASSYAPARRMGFRDRGSVSPGKIADLLLLADKAEGFQIERIFKNGQEYHGKTKPAMTTCFDSTFTSTLNVPQNWLSKDLFTVQAPGNSTHVRCRTMHKNPTSTYTEESITKLLVQDGIVRWQDEEVNLVHVLNRYSGRGEYACGFVSGEIFRQGAVCTSYAHDCHNLLTAGDNEGDMLMALHWVIDHQGGICAVSQGRIIASLPLRIGGILSEAPMEQLSDSVKRLQTAMKELGYRHPNPLMSFSTLTLPVSPALKITDKGLIDVNVGQSVSLFL
ncbi:adenosine deaminase [candidate division KSB3 bacterium]|uniref:Adenine deaminase n=1 Tax=candidate division KSB3 bacterium TaxID=2044937 RepID=A0A2G6KJB3_9BACT|nr:MAG: adenosine deaminase [candidate division KSB3 bacterium]